MSRVGEEENDSNNMLNMILISLATPCKRPITKEKKEADVILLPTATEDAKINAPTDESSASMLATQCNFPATFVDPAKFIPNVFPDVSLMHPMVQALDAALSETRDNIEDATVVSATVNLPVNAQSSSSTYTIETGKMKSEGKDMQMILIDFSEPQEDYTLKSSSTTITF